MTQDLSSLLSDLVTVTHRLSRVAARATGETTSPAAWRTLAVLSNAGPLRLGELAASSRVSQPTMTKIAANLNELGWIVRIPDETDARAWQIDIAPEGKEALADWRRRLGDALAPYFEDMDDEEERALRHSVEIISERIQRLDPRAEVTAAKRASAAVKA